MTTTTQTTRSDIRTSTWANGDREQYDRLHSLVPAVLDTHFGDWQERVDRTEGDADIGQFIDYLVPVVATEYATKITPEYPNGIHAPVEGSDRTYLVSVDIPHKAHDVVIAYLKEQAPGKSFATSTKGAICVLSEAKH